MGAWWSSPSSPLDMVTDLEDSKRKCVRLIAKYRRLGDSGKVQLLEDTLRQLRAMGFEMEMKDVQHDVVKYRQQLLRLRNYIEMDSAFLLECERQAVEDDLKSEMVANLPVFALSSEDTDPLSLPSAPSHAVVRYTIPAQVPPS